MGSAPLPTWAAEPCIMGIDEAGRGPVLGPMVYGCLYCPLAYQNTLASLHFADSKTLKEEKREELFGILKANESIGWEVDVIDPRELSAKMLQAVKINLNEISHNSAMGLVRRVLDMGILLTEVYVDTVGDVEKYRVKLSEKFPGIRFVVAKKADSLYPVVSGASIVAKVTRDRALHDWVLDETAENMHRNFESGYPGDPATKAWLDHHKHPVFGFPTVVRFSWGTCTPYFKDNVEVIWESDKQDEDNSNSGGSKRQLKLSNVGFTGYKRKIEDIETSGKGRSPRVVWLADNGKQLIQWPIKELESLRKEEVSFQGIGLKTGALFRVKGIKASQADVEVEFELPSLEGVEPVDPAWLLDPQGLCGKEGALVQGVVGPFGLLVLASYNLQEHTAVFFRVFKGHDSRYIVLMCADLRRLGVGR